ncbi:MAG: cytochrome c-type biogenesis protein [Burkholderiaceae bacterium]
MKNRLTPTRGRLLAAALLAIALAAGSTGPATAQAARPRVDTLLQSSEHQARYQRLAEELRCLVCQNQTLADSNAGLAGDLRHLVETMIIAGSDDAAIKQHLVDRYGDFVLYRPPVRQNTWLLWFGPFGLLAVGALTWLLIARRNRIVARPGHRPGLGPEGSTPASKPAPGAPGKAAAAVIPADRDGFERARRLLDGG